MQDFETKATLTIGSQFSFEFNADAFENAATFTIDKIDDADPSKNSWLSLNDRVFSASASTSRSTFGCAADAACSKSYKITVRAKSDKKDDPGVTQDFTLKILDN